MFLEAYCSASRCTAVVWRREGSFPTAACVCLSSHPLSPLANPVHLLIQQTAVLILRVPRALRLLRVAKYSPILQVFMTAVHESLDALLILVFLIVIALILFATMVHFAERGDSFQPDRPAWIKYHSDGSVSEPPFYSVARSMWWCMATLTTVGYGTL